jgi:uncharacterized protein
MKSDPLVIMWQRLDQPGHEVMRFAQDGDGASIEGHVAYRESEGPIGLRYEVRLWPDWTTHWATIKGQAQGRSFDHSIARGSDGWIFDGCSQSELDEIPHLDLGFTPATNMPQLRHAALKEGQAASFDVAWFDIGKDGLERLEQRYRRLGSADFAYESPATGYEARLRFAADEFTLDYPDLWMRVAG